MLNLASATYCETRFVVDSARYNACLGLLNLNEDFDGVNGGNPFANMATIASARYQNLGLVSGAAGATIGAATTVAEVSVDAAETVAGVTIDAAETVATTVTPLNNLGLISDIGDIYACATTEEQAYCVSKAKSYGVFTGVNGSVYNKCIADICAAKQPELTNLIGGIAATGITVGLITPTVIAAEILTPLNNLGLISDIGDIYACATTEEQAYCVSKAKSYGVFTGVNGSVYNKCIADICAAKQPGLTNLGLVSGAAGATIGAVTTVAEVSVDAAETAAGDIGDIYACATTEEQAYCVSKAKSYGVFTGVNGSVYNKCIADICAAKQPGLVTLLN